MGVMEFPLHLTPVLAQISSPQAEALLGQLAYKIPYTHIIVVLGVWIFIRYGFDNDQ